MNHLTNKTIQLLGGFVLALVALTIIGICAIIENDVPRIMENAVALILGSFLGVSAVNGIDGVRKK